MAVEKGFARRMEADRNTAAGVAVDITPKRSVGEIIHDDNEVKRFDLFLDKTGASAATKGAWARYAGGTPKESDMALIQPQYHEYMARLAKFEKVDAALKTFNDDILTHSLVFRDFSNFKGAENIRATLVEGLRDMALAEPAEFSAVEAEVKKLIDRQSEEDKQDLKIKAWADKYGFKEEEKIRAIMAKPTEKERRLGLERLFTDSMNAWDKESNFFKRWFGYGSLKKAREISREDFMQTTEERKDASENAGSYMKALLVTNPYLRHALARRTHGHSPVFSEGSETRPTVTKLKEGVKRFEKTALVEQAAQFKRDNAHLDWADAGVLSLARTTFKDIVAKAAREFKKQSFFAGVLYAVNGVKDPLKVPEVVAALA